MAKNSTVLAKSSIVFAKNSIKSTKNLSVFTEIHQKRLKTHWAISELSVIFCFSENNGYVCPCSRLCFCPCSPCVCHSRAYSINFITSTCSNSWNSIFQLPKVLVFPALFRWNVNCCVNWTVCKWRWVQSFWSLTKTHTHTPCRSVYHSSICVTRWS